MLILVLVAVFICVAALVGGVALLLHGDSGTAVEDRLEVLTGSGPARTSRDGAGEPTLLASPLDDVPNVLETLENIEENVTPTTAHDLESLVYTIFDLSRPPERRPGAPRRLALFHRLRQRR